MWCCVVQEMQTEVNGLQSQLNYMLDVVDKCRADKMTGRLSASLADSVASVIERHGKLQTDINDTLSQIELAHSNVEDFKVRHRIPDQCDQFVRTVLSLMCVTSMYSNSTRQLCTGHVE